LGGWSLDSQPLYKGLIMTEIEFKVVEAWRQAAHDLSIRFTSPFTATLERDNRIECIGLPSIPRPGEHLSSRRLFEHSSRLRGLHPRDIFALFLRKSTVSRPEETI
jgi:hypothetical protein